MLFLIVKKLRKYVTSSVMLYAILLTGPASMLAIEFGWFLTEMGRQPWIIRGICAYQRRLPRRGITLVTTLFGLLYLLLLVTSAYVLIRMFKNQPAYKDVEK